jgi:uncharacterized protein (TIGR02680 family)
MLDARASEPNRLPEPDRERWTVLRAGIQNVWEYDDRRFVFRRGRLLLRGRNEAGKTKAVELLFPFLLDADLAPQRLDPFGSNARPMRWNLINDADPNAQLRLGYVWLELGRIEDGAPVFFTIGAGLKARRSATDVEAWFFVTSQRPDRDVRFTAEDRRPLTRGELGEAIGPTGQVFERHGDYRRAVNARLFGMPDEQYAALVETLLHLRRPQLSKALDVDGLSGFLTSSLPPLDPAVVAPIAEGFERLDHRRADLESLERVRATLAAFEGVYRSYALAFVKGRAVELTRAESAYQKARSEARERAAERDGVLAQREALEQRATELIASEREHAARVRALEASDEFRAARDLDEAEASARASERRREGALRRAEDDARLASRAARQAEGAKGEVGRREPELDRARDAANLRASDAALGSLLASVDALALRGEVAAARSALEALLHEREEALVALRALAQALAAADGAARRAEERARERASDVETARDALLAAESAAAAAREAWGDAFFTWQAGLSVLPWSAADAGAIEPGCAAAEAARLAAPVREALATDRAGILEDARRWRDEHAHLARERDALAAAPHPLPAPPAWRRERPEDRPGAPLYLLCDFGEGARGREACIEAALEASGLLDAWVEPSGCVLDPLTGDALLRGAPSSGKTLADVLVPVAAGGVATEAARAALAAVGWAEAGEEGAGATWVAADGRFRLGALTGAHAKSAAAFVGAGAREEERARRLADLAARMEGLAARAAASEQLAAEVGARLARLVQELEALPSGAAHAAAEARVAVRAEALSSAREALQAAEGQAREAASARSRAAAALDAAAADRGLAAWARDPDGLAARTRAFETAAERLLGSAEALATARAAAEGAAVAARELEAASARSTALAGEATAEAGTSRARADVLRDASGAAVEEVLRRIDEERAAADAALAGAAAAARERSILDERKGALDTAVVAAEGTAAACEERRKSAAETFHQVAREGLLAEAGLALAEAPEAVSYTGALEAARRVDAAIEKGGTDEERASAENRVMQRQSELHGQLPAEMRLLTSRAGDVLRCQFVFGARTHSAREALAEIAAQVEARTALLGEDERKLIEEFLSGEAHDHLAARLREARRLVDRMNAALERRATASGSQVRLSWEVDAEHAGARDAVALFLRAGHLLTEGNREALKRFLQERLDGARQTEGVRPLQDRLIEALDYRPWHRFVVQHREPGQAWVPLTRKAHAAGSGGKKAVMLHLPLFAAAAAFYDAAQPGAPRLIALDEAFAGIDRPMRGQLMGLLAEFDLDFVMTSYEEWGFYAELDGLSTYHLSRDPAMRGVHAEWFLWDGREQVLVEEA